MPLYITIVQWTLLIMFEPNLATRLLGDERRHERVFFTKRSMMG